MGTSLLFHNILYSFNILLSIGFIFFLFLKAKKGIARDTLILDFFCATIFMVSHVLGVSVKDPNLSRQILMFNLVVIFMPIVTAHCVFAFINKLKEQKKILLLFYSAGSFLVIFFILNPYLYLKNSIPKMYFPNYYEGAEGYKIMLIFFSILVIYCFFVMFKAYRNADQINKNRIKYFAIALLLAYAFGSVDFFLVLDIPLNPLLGSFFIPSFAIPFTYAAVQYELMDIRLIAKKGFVFIIISGVVGLMLSLLNYFDNFIIEKYPFFPNWGSSFILALFTTIGLLIVWKKIRTADLLKYEFVNIIMHKFRTPLTAIRWFSEKLEKEAPIEFKEDISGIQKSSQNLIELTNLLTNLSVIDGHNFEYNLVKVDLNNLIQELLEEVDQKIKFKNIKISFLPNANCFILADEHKTKFVFQTLIENAITYNKKGGNLDIEINTNQKEMIFKITDSGIGISESEIKNIFNKFFRTPSAKRADTEGMGIGLYLSKRIVEKHNGKIWIKSEGLEKGTTFFVQLPLFKE